MLLCAVTIQSLPYRAHEKCANNTNGQIFLEIYNLPTPVCAQNCLSSIADMYGQCFPLIENQLVADLTVDIVNRDAPCWLVGWTGQYQCNDSMKQLLYKFCSYKKTGYTFLNFEYNPADGKVVYKCSAQQDCLTFSTASMYHGAAASQIIAPYYNALTSKPFQLAHKLDENEVCVPNTTQYYLTAEPVSRSVKVGATTQDWYEQVQCGNDYILYRPSKNSGFVPAFLCLSVKGMTYNVDTAQITMFCSGQKVFVYFDNEGDTQTQVCSSFCPKPKFYGNAGYLSLVPHTYRYEEEKGDYVVDDNQDCQILKLNQEIVQLDIQNNINLSFYAGNKFLQPRNVANWMSGNSSYLNYTSPQYDFQGGLQNYQQLFTIVEECDSLQADYKRVCYPYVYDRVSCNLSIGTKKTKICEALTHDVFPDQQFCNIGYLPVNESYCMAVKDCAHTWQLVKNGLVVKNENLPAPSEFHQDVWKCNNESDSCDFEFVPYYQQCVSVSTDNELLKQMTAGVKLPEHLQYKQQSRLHSQSEFLSCVNEKKLEFVDSTKVAANCVTPCEFTDFPRLEKDGWCTDECQSHFLINETHCYPNEDDLIIECGAVQDQILVDQFNFQCLPRVEASGIVFGAVAASVFMIMIVQLMYVNASKDKKKDK